MATPDKQSTEDPAESGAANADDQTLAAGNGDESDAPAEEFPVAVVAARKLSANQLLTARDLRAEPSGAIYASRDIASGDTISQKDVAAFPLVDPKAGKLPVILRFPHGETFKVGDEVQLCSENVFVASAPLRAQFCSALDSACLAVLDLSPADAEKVAAAIDKMAIKPVQPEEKSCP